MNLGYSIAAVRKAKSMTRKQLAEQVGVSSRTVGIWERNESLPQTVHLPAIAKALEISLDELLIDEKVSEAADESMHPFDIHCFYTDAIDEVRAKLGENAKAWALILDRTDDPDVEQIQVMAMIFDSFMRTEDRGFADTHLTIVNEPGSNDISWKRTEDGYVIHLSVQSGNDWGTVGYQLGYTMMHCLIDHLGKEKPSIAWAEELICEASALFLLESLSEFWDDTPFADAAPDYWENIDKMIETVLDEEGLPSLQSCEDRNALRTIGEACSIKNRIHESHELYMSMFLWENVLTDLANVREYAFDNLLLCTHYWRAFCDDAADDIVDFICKLQERIPGCELPKGTTININLRKSQPTSEQLEAYGNLIRTMRILPVEHVIFEFLRSYPEDGEQKGLVFYQVTRERDGSIQAEFRLDTEERRKMYRIFCDDDQAVHFLTEIALTGNAPDLTGWKDITEEIFPNKMHTTQKYLPDEATP